MKKDELHMDVEDRTNEPEERQSATIEDMVDVDKKKVKRKAKVISKEVQLEKNVQWAFEHPAEALFVGMSSALSQKHPEVKKRVFDLINTPPEKRLQKVFGSEMVQYIKSRLPY